ncbi:MAG TPA: HisA/HisF-related TIM barrel protein, partial [Solirubrobacterales bacterium]|nr:HisA/HisF-related TIM barrel protein [Solirubrobacterales bacterium]
NRPELLTELAAVFGSQCVVIAIDAKRNEDGNYGVFLNGGRVETGRDAIEWATEATRLGAGEVLLTSMDRDGTNIGYEIELTRRVAEATDVPVIASGGAGELNHLVEAIKDGKADAVLCASIFHYGHYTVEQAKEHMASHQIPVRVT